MALDIRNSSAHAFIDLNPAHSVFDGLASGNDWSQPNDGGGADFAQYFAGDRFAFHSDASAPALAVAQTAFSFFDAHDAPEHAALAGESQNLVSAHASTKAATFNPNTFKINPGNLGAAVGQIASAITQGYAPAKAIALLEKASGKVNVSFDDMLALTDTKLHTMSSARAVAAGKAFNIEIKTRLTSDAAATALATLVHAGHLNTSAAGGIILKEAKEATPGAAQDEHAVAQLLAALLAKHVAAAQVRALAKQDAALVIAGLEKESAPGAVDLSAGARVLESELTVYSASAAAKVEKLFAGFDATAAKWATLNTIEAAGLKDAVTDKVLTQAKANSWSKALDKAQDAAAAKLVDPIALQLAAGTINDTTATQELKAMAPTPAKLDALMLTAAEANPSDSTANALGLLEVYASLDGALVDQAGLDKTLNQLVTDVMTTSGTTLGVNASSLLQILQRAIGFGAITDAKAVTIVTEAANTDKADGPDQWLLDAANGLGAPSVVYNDGYARVFLAVGNAMAARLKSGAFLAAMEKDYLTGGWALGSINSYIEEYAPLAIASNFATDSKAENILGDPDLTQIDGVSADDRVGYELIQLVGDLSNKESASQATADANFIYQNDTNLYVTGLGFTAGFGDDATIAANLALADQVIKVGDMAGVTAAGNNAGSGVVAAGVSAENSAIYQTASADADSGASAFQSGLNTFYTYANNYVQNSTSPAASIIKADENIATDPGNFTNWIDLGASTLNLVIQTATPELALLSKIGAIAGIAGNILEDTGLGTLLGPVGGDLEDAAGVITGVTNGVNQLINGFVTAPIETAVNIGETFLHVGENLGTLGTDLFTGNFSGAGQAAEQLATQLGSDVVNLVGSVATTLYDTATALVSDLESVGEDLLNAVESIPQIFTSAVDDIADAFSDAWDAVSNWL